MRPYYKLYIFFIKSKISGGYPLKMLSTAKEFTACNRIKNENNPINIFKAIQLGKIDLVKNLAIPFNSGLVLAGT
jgi:hypothetical protein